MTKNSSKENAEKVDIIIYQFYTGNVRKKSFGIQ